MQVRQRLRENGLALAWLLFFLVAFVGQALAGHAVFNEEARDHGTPELGLGAYLLDPHFWNALAENWQSEFLQMGLFVWVSDFLRQKGSSESKELEGKSETDEDPRKHRNDPGVPWPVRRGGVVLRVYEHSLSITLFALFAASWALHARMSFLRHVVDEQAHGHPRPSFVDFLGTGEFWFETFQNWQSEFLAVFALVVLTIFLRERGSAQSKAVHAPHAQTG